MSVSVEGTGAFEAWLYVAILTGIAVFLLRKGLDAFWRLRTITDTPTARIRSAAQGYVELSGRALPWREPLAGPLTASPCVWYRFSVEQRKGSGKNSRWVRVDGGEAEGPFVLDDDTGRCLVEAATADLRLAARDVWHGPSRHPQGPPERDWLIFQRSYRYTEERIAAGEAVYLLGLLQTPRRGPAERERLARELLSTWKRDPARMASFDTNDDGDIDLHEWEAARAKAERVAARAEQRVQAEPALSRVTRTGDPARPFIISTLGEGALTRRLRLMAYGGGLGFLGLAAVAGALAIARLGG